MEARTSTDTELNQPQTVPERNAMPLLPVELRNTSGGEKAAFQIDRAMQAARTRIARRRTLRVAASTLPVPIAAAALWVALSRFTLLELPRWPVFLFVLLWLVMLLIVSRTHKVTTSQSARYLDRTLSLDERLTTLLELARQTPVRRLSRPVSRVPMGLLEDTAFELKARSVSLPSAWHYRFKRWQSVAIGAALLLLFSAMVIPTGLDAVRAERQALRRTVDTELVKIADLRAELVTKPGLSDNDRAAMQQELDQLTEALSAPELERSSLLAALSDAQQKLQSLSSMSSADFNSILTAARTMQSAALDASRTGVSGPEDTSDWNPADYPDLSDLGKAAKASDVIGAKAKSFTSAQIRSTIPYLERASTQAAPEDTELAQDLLDASKSVSIKDAEKTALTLKDASQRFLDADQRYQLAQSVERIMASLDEGRQTVAEAGTKAVKKGQVGFRRPGGLPGDPAPTGQGANPANDAQASGTATQDDQGISLGGPSALGATGANSPDYAGLKNSSGGSSSGGQTGSQGGSQGGTQGATGSTQQGGTNGSAGTNQPGTGSSGTGDGSQGTFSGQVSGPMGGGSGAISQVPNPAGQGVSDGSSPVASDPAQNDSVFVPSAQSDNSGATNGGVPGQAAPEQQKPGGIEGRTSDGGDGSTQVLQNTGSGTHNDIRTPYKEVIGQYAQEATQALERVYVPADAKEYVKDYFSQLGK
ncbi:MAG: hypothetical protein ABI670_00545 [Chloroflexota bacterium]